MKTSTSPFIYGGAVIFMPKKMGNLQHTEFSYSPKKIISNANDSDSFNELKPRQNYCRIRTGAFTCAMVHLVSRATFYMQNDINLSK